MSAKTVFFVLGSVVLGGIIINALLELYFDIKDPYWRWRRW